MIALCLHGGAGADPARSYELEKAHMRGVVEDARRHLMEGASALDVAISATREMERAGLYIAGRGASPNANGEFELDACVMDGRSGKVGAVAALQGFQSPVTVARSILDRTPHVLLAGFGAAEYARTIGAEAVPSPEWFTPACVSEANALGTGGTVGCVVRDRTGRLAAATSTAGVFNKLPGRVGDSPIVGAGTWADRNCAVSCTGLGEYFLRAAAACQLAHRIRWANQGLADAARSVIAEIHAAGGHGGLIAVDRDGNIAMPFATSGMKRAALRADGQISVEVF